MNILFILSFEASNLININKDDSFSIFISYNLHFRVYRVIINCHILIQYPSVMLYWHLNDRTLSMMMSFIKINFNIYLQVYTIYWKNYKRKSWNSEPHELNVPLFSQKVIIPIIHLFNYSVFISIPLYFSYVYYFTRYLIFI